MKEGGAKAGDRIVSNIKVFKGIGPKGVDAENAYCGIEGVVLEVEDGDCMVIVRYDEHRTPTTGLDASVIDDSGTGALMAYGWDEIECVPATGEDGKDPKPSTPRPRRPKQAKPKKHGA